MITMETIVQATDSRGEHSVESPLKAQELLPTIYFHLGIYRRHGRWAGRYESCPMEIGYGSWWGRSDRPIRLRDCRHEDLAVEN